MRYFSIEDIDKKIKRYYKTGDIFRNFIAQTDIFPIIVKLQTIRQKDIQDNFTTISRDIQKIKNKNFNIIYKQFNFRSIGVQLLPYEIKIENLDDYLRLTKKENEYEKFVNLYKKIVKLYPTLKNLILKKPFIVLDYQNEWDNFCTIIDFFLKNKNPNIYIREISLNGVDTKYIERYKKILDILLSDILQIEPLGSIADFAFEKKYSLKYILPQIRFRVLDDNLKILNLSDMTLNIDEFKDLKLECKKVFIVENKITTLSFPKVKESIVIFGSGYKVGVLKDIGWLKDKELYYWGDIDMDGFAILSQIRGYFSSIKSIFMDENTIFRYKHLSVQCAKLSQEKELNHLTEEEMEIYNKLKNNTYGKNFRLEQERLPFSLITQTFKIRFDVAQEVS